jgi:hypothetical protein
MANTQDWVDALGARGVYIPYTRRPTSEVYSQIKSLGLETVLWETYYGEEVRDTAKIHSFIQKNKPCLFIFDPTSRNGLKKDFLFGVTNPEEVEKWIRMHYSQLKHYSFLITTQIFNPGNGFVGTAITDGNGRMFIETLHKPGVCNQRELSQPKENISQYLDHACIDGDDVAITKGFLRKSDITRIHDTYFGQKGYFEFVYGRQLGRDTIYTTGHEYGGLFTFPSDLHTLEFVNTRNRLLGRLIMG